MAQNDLDNIEELLRKGRYADAIERYRVLLSVDPENAEVRARCGEAYRLSGNKERAFHHFNKAASIYAREGDAESAFHMLQFANSVSPNEPDILFRMAECMKVLGQTANLEPLCRQIVSVARGSGDRRRLWALDELCSRHPEDLDLALRRAETLTEAGRVNDAVNAWKLVSARLDQRGIDFVPMLMRAAAIAPDRSDVGVDLAGVLLANRRPREALILLVPYYEKFPDDIGILEMLLRALESLGAMDKIIPARIELIKARAKRGQREPAIREIQILLQQAPDDITALEVCAHAYTAFGDGNEAVAMWRRLTHACDRQGRRFERDRAILMLLKANPDDEEALTLGARALREAGRNEEASVLENRLALIKRLRARQAQPHSSQAPQKASGSSERATEKPPSYERVEKPDRLHRAEQIAERMEREAKIEKAPRGSSNPFGAEDGMHARARAGSGATVLQAEDLVPDSGSRPGKAGPPMDANQSRPNPRRRSSIQADIRIEEQTMPPREEDIELDFSMINPSDMSEPSLEAMPIAKNPYTDGLELGVAGVVSQAGRAPAVMDTAEMGVELTSPTSPAVPSRGSEKRATVIAYDETSPSAPALRAPSVPRDTTSRQAPVSPSASRPSGSSPSIPSRSASTGSRSVPSAGSSPSLARAAAQSGPLPPGALPRPPSATVHAPGPPAPRGRGSQLPRTTRPMEEAVPFDDEPAPDAAPTRMSVGTNPRMQEKSGDHLAYARATTVTNQSHEKIDPASLDFPTRPYPAQMSEMSELADQWQPEDATQTGEKAPPTIPDDGETGTEFGTFGIDDPSDAFAEGSFEDELLPIESPGAPEETTSRIAQLVDDELDALRSQFADRTERGPNARHETAKDAARSPTPLEFDTESIRPTAKLKLLGDLFQEPRSSSTKKA